LGIFSVLKGINTIGPCEIMRTVSINPEMKCEEDKCNPITAPSHMLVEKGEKGAAKRDLNKKKRGLDVFLFPCPQRLTHMSPGSGGGRWCG
jgi:hypothetical protein